MSLAFLVSRVSSIYLAMHLTTIKAKGFVGLKLRDVINYTEWQGTISVAMLMMSSNFTFDFLVTTTLLAFVFPFVMNMTVSGGKEEIDEQESIRFENETTVVMFVYMVLFSLWA